MSSDPRLTVLMAIRRNNPHWSAVQVLAVLDAEDPLRQPPGDEAVESAFSAWFVGNPPNSSMLRNDMRRALIAALAVMSGETAPQFVNRTIGDAPAGVRLSDTTSHPAFDPTNPSGTSWALNPWVPMSKPIDLKHLGKLAEELNEAGSAVARCIIQGIDECEPVTLKQNREWLEDELADVTANIDLVIDHFGLDRERMQTRAARKRTHLRAWHTMLISEDADKRPLATPPELLIRAKNQWADACIERDAVQEEVVRLRSTLRDTITALDVAAIALDAAGDKIAASVAAAAIGNARKVLGDE